MPIKIDKWCDPKDQISKLGRNSWNVPKLLELSKNLPILIIPIEHLNIYNYYDKVTIREFVMHMRAVNAADLKYPIILDEDSELMDGRHRIIKALLLNKKTIKAVRFEENPPPDKTDK